MEEKKCKVIFGRIGRTPELRRAEGGGIRCHFALRVDSGEGEAPKWWWVVLSGERAQMAAGCLRKGSRIFVKGKTTTKTLTTGGGQKELRRGSGPPGGPNGHLRRETMEKKRQDRGDKAIVQCYGGCSLAEETPGVNPTEPSVRPMGAPPSIHDKRIWFIEDVMEFTGFSKSTVYKMTSRKELPHRKRGKKLFFLPSEVWNWLEEG